MAASSGQILAADGPAEVEIKGRRITDEQKRHLRADFVTENAYDWSKVLFQAHVLLLLAITIFAGLNSGSIGRQYKNYKSTMEFKILVGNAMTAFHITLGSECKSTEEAKTLPFAKMTLTVLSNTYVYFMKVAEETGELSLLPPNLEKFLNRCHELESNSSLSYDEILKQITESERDAILSFDVFNVLYLLPMWAEPWKEFAHIESLEFIYNDVNSVISTLELQSKVRRIEACGEDKPLLHEFYSSTYAHDLVRKPEPAELYKDHAFNSAIAGLDIFVPRIPAMAIAGNSTPFQVLFFRVYEMNGHEELNKLLIRAGLVDNSEEDVDMSSSSPVPPELICQFCLFWYRPLYVVNSHLSAVGSSN